MPLSPAEEAAMRAALDVLRREPGVRYAEVRFVENRSERLRDNDCADEQQRSDRSRRKSRRVPKGTISRFVL